MDTATELLLLMDIDDGTAASVEFGGDPDVTFNTDPDVTFGVE